MKVCPGEMSQNFPITEPVSEASYSAEIDLEIAIPLSVSLVYRDQGRFCNDKQRCISLVVSNPTKCFSKDMRLALNTNGWSRFERMKLIRDKNSTFKLTNSSFPLDPGGTQLRS